MNKDYSNTSSSIYDDDIDFMGYRNQISNPRDRYRQDAERMATRQKLYRTPSPKPKKKTALFSNEESPSFQDDVYLPYVTPPTPFEKSTQEKGFFEDETPTNPYAQSLWYTSRGNKGTEVDKYGKVTTEMQSPQFLEAVPVLVEPNGERKELLPSLMLKKDFGDPSSLDVNAINVERNSNTKFNRVKSSYAVLSDPTPVFETFRDLRLSDSNELHSIENSILKPLNNPPPFEFISIQSQIVKKLKRIYLISLEFQNYIKQSNLLLNSKVKMYLFSNVETLLLLHHKFLSAILNRDGKIDIEELIFDNLQRLYHVYPSYLSCIKLRNHFTKLIIQNPKFNAFVLRLFTQLEQQDAGSTLTSSDAQSRLLDSQSEFYNLMISPTDDFRNLLKYLDEYIGPSSPRISVLIQKFFACWDEVANTKANTAYKSNENESIFAIDEYEPLYLEIPSQWKLEHKMNWKEISNCGAEKQLAYYLRHEIKQEYHQYQKLIKHIKLQIDQISKLAICGHYIADKFTTIDVSLPKNGQFGDKYNLHLENIDQKNKKIYQLVESFTIFLASERFSVTEELVKDITKFAKHIFNSDEELSSSRYSSVVDQIYQIHQFKILFKQQIYMILMKFLQFFKQYLHIVIASPNSVQPPSTSSILDSFHRRIRDLGTQVNIGIGNNEKGPWLNEELARACARDRLVRRFFT